MKTITSITFFVALLQGAHLAAMQGQQPYQGSAELERIKSLAGQWKGKMEQAEGPMDITVEYRVVAGGSAVEERTFAGTPMEMVTMYHDREGKLALTHYCMLHNQPGMILKSADDTSISFDFDESSSIDVSKEAHMHALTLTLNEDGTLTHDWTMFEEGESKGGHPYTLTRADS